MSKCLSRQTLKQCCYYAKITVMLTAALGSSLGYIRIKPSEYEFYIYSQRLVVKLANIFWFILMKSSLKWLAGLSAWSGWSGLLVLD